VIDASVIAAAQAAQKATRVPASVSIAQYGLESGWGKHMPLNSNNPFGIKAFHGGGVDAETTEFVGGKIVHEEQPFAIFPDLSAAFLAHARLIATLGVYAPAMAQLPNLEAFVKLMAQHYATDPAYATKILGIIHIDGLEQYDA
jgi:flagellum-specific peptidoglycan hydrolase FlgJ